MKKAALSLSLLGILSVFLAFLGVWPNLRGADQEDPEIIGNSIVGSWDITITGSPFRILRTYNPGGGVVDAYAFPPFTFTTGPLINSAGHGTWVKTGPRQVKVLVKYFQLNPQKNATFQVLDSFGTVGEVVNLEGPDSYTSSFTTNIFRPDGTHVLTNAGHTQGTRIKVE